jgi:hypothetical protein
MVAEADIRLADGGTLHAYAFACRSPRLSRCRVVMPDEAGTASAAEVGRVRSADAAI